MSFDCTTRTHVGLRRKCNEDSVLSLPEKGMWAIADGMGGHDAGEVASAKVIEALAALPPVDDPQVQADAALQALAQVNRELVELAQPGFGNRTIGSTVVGLVIGAGQYRCFWAGDSRAYLLRNGALRPITRDHSLVQGLVDAGMMDEAEAAEHPNAHVLTRAVGAARRLEVEVAGGEALPGDLFLLASDGLTRVVGLLELQEALQSGTPEQAADGLIATTLARGAPDNVTLAIVRIC